MHSVGLFSVIREKLLSAGQPVTIAMFNTLFEVKKRHLKFVCVCTLLCVYIALYSLSMNVPQVLVDCPSRKIIDSHYLALDLAHQIKFPGEYN